MRYRYWVAIGTSIILGVTLIASGTGKLLAQNTPLANTLPLLGVTPGLAIFITHGVPWAELALGAVASVPMRAKAAEKVLEGKDLTDELLDEAGRVASEETSPISNIHASEEYRRELVKVLVKQVAKEALERAKKA